MSISSENSSKNEIDILRQQKKLLCEYWKKNESISNSSVLQAFLDVRRELFVDPDYYYNSYNDRALPIGLGQTISQPSTVMLMLQLLGVSPGQIVLEIGTGSGYNAALLSRLTEPKGMVVTIERHSKLVKLAKKNLINNNFQEVLVINGDGKDGYEKLAPFDRIVITAASDRVPQNLKDQLNVGGFIVAPIGKTNGCDMLKIEKISDKNFKISSHGTFSFVPLI